MIKVRKAEKEARKVLREFIGEALNQYGYIVAERWLGNKLSIKFPTIIFPHKTEFTDHAQSYNPAQGPCEILLARNRLYFRIVGDLPYYITDISDPECSTKLLDAIKEEHLKALKLRLVFGERYVSTVTKEIEKLSK